MKKGTVVYFKNSRLIEWETSLPEVVTPNKLYSVTEVGVCDGSKHYVKIWDGGSHYFHKDHFVEANTELLNIEVFEIGDEVECVDNSHTNRDTNNDRMIGKLVIGENYTVLDYVVSNGVSYVMCAIYKHSSISNGYYLPTKHFKNVKKIIC